MNNPWNIYPCRVCGLQDWRIEVNDFDELSCEECFNWIRDIILPYVHHKLRTACDHNDEIIAIISQTDDHIRLGKMS